MGIHRLPRVLQARPSKSLLRIFHGRIHFPSDRLNHSKVTLTSSGSNCFPACALNSFRAGADGTPKRTSVDHNLINVGDADYPGAKRDVVTWDSSGISGSLPPIVVGQYLPGTYTN